MLGTAGKNEDTLINDVLLWTSTYGLHVKAPVIDVGNGHGDMSSNLERDCQLFSACALDLAFLGPFLQISNSSF